METALIFDYDENIKETEEYKIKYENINDPPVIEAFYIEEWGTWVPAGRFLDVYIANEKGLTFAFTEVDINDYDTVVDDFGTKLNIDVLLRYLAKDGKKLLF